MHLGILEKTAANAAAASIMNDEGPAVVDISAVSVTSVNIRFECRLAGAIAVILDGSPRVRAKLGWGVEVTTDGGCRVARGSFVDVDAASVGRVCCGGGRAAGLDAFDVHLDGNVTVLVDRDLDSSTGAASRARVRGNVGNKVGLTRLAAGATALGALQGTVFVGGSGAVPTVATKTGSAKSRLSHQSGGEKRCGELHLGNDGVLESKTPVSICAFSLARSVAQRMAWAHLC